MEHTRLKICAMPRDRFDWRLNFFLIVGTVAVELVILSLLSYLGPIGTWLTQALLVALIVRLFQITIARVDATEDGIYAVGLLGRGRLIPWDQIESIEEIDRGAYFHDALRCLYTNNLAPLSGTFSGIFKVRLKNGQYWLFPPEDRELFERKVVWKRQQKQPMPRYYAQAEEAPVQQVTRRWWQ
ncbi:MAG: PH domain-containing protein [Armatimonas sp.]